MANAQEAVRRLTIQTSAPGAAEATADLNALAAAQGGVAVASQSTERATLNLDRSFASIERRYVTQVKAQQDYERVQRQVNAAVSLNPALQERASAVLAAAEARFSALTKAANDNAQALERQAAAAAQAAAVQARVNGVTGVSGGSDSAARAVDVAAYGKALDDLRAKYNPLFAAGQTYKTTLMEINQALKAGAISEQERAAAVMDTKVAFIQQVNALRGVRDATDLSSAASGKLAASTGLARHELINLSRQAQDVVVSLAGGQGLGTVLLQQGSQIGDVFASSRASVGDFAKQATTYLRGFLTSGTAAFGGVVVAVGGAILALNSFLTQQDKVRLALSGAGRGSGATVGSINSIASSASSPFGLSVSSARDLASALAQTGKVANDNLLPIVQIGRDFATTFGVSDVEAAKTLAQAFADPVRGAEQLNERLGFLDAGMQRQIASLVAQNRLYDAQRVLLDGVKGSLAKTSEVTSVWSQAWTAAKNAASGFYDYVGEKLAKAGGLDASIEQQRDNLKKLIADYNNPFSPGSVGGGSDLETLKRQLSDINALIEKRAQATQNVAAAQASLRVSQTILTQLPEIGARQALQDAASIGGATAEDPILMKALGLTQQQVDRAKAILNQLRDDFKTTFDEIRSNSQISFDAVTAFSPGAKAAIAQRQAVEQYRSAGGLDPSEKARIGQDAYNLSIHQTVTALQEAGRARVLSANQAVASAQLETDLVGKTVGQQAELRANLQARQALEQQASQYRTAFDDAEYERLKKINAELGKRTQEAARASINDNISFGRQTSLLSSDDIQIAQQLKGIYPDVATALGSVEASALRTNQALSGISSSLSNSLTSGLTDIAMGTKSVKDGFSDMTMSILKDIEQMIIKLYVVGPLMQSLQGGLSGLGGLGGIFGSSSGAAAQAASASTLASNTGGAFFGPGFHSGGIVGAEPSFMRMVGPSHFAGATRLHTGGIAGDEVPIIAKRGEGVFTQGQMAAMGGASSPKVNVTVNNFGSDQATVTRKQSASGDIDFEVMIGNATAKQAGNPGSSLSRVLDQRGRLASR